MENLRKKALRISYFSVGYHFIEGFLSILAGMSAGSIALLGFGLDSFVESLSGLIVIWRFLHIGKISKKDEERAEKKALRLIAYSFFLLAVYVFYESFRKLYFHLVAGKSIFGIVIAVVSLIVMPILFYMKRETGKAVKSHSLVADAKQQLACMLLSLSLLVGLGLNYLFGFWEADPLMGMIIVIFLVWEGIATLKEEEACAC